MAEILWEQTPQRTFQPGLVKTHYVWSTRGKLVAVQGEKALPKLLAEGFIPASEAELKRYKPGSYFPHYDRSVQPNNTVLGNKAEIHNGDSLELVWL